MLRWSALCLLSGYILLGFTKPASAAANNDRGIELFETKIRPVLVEQCYRCHSVEADKKKKLRGGLMLDSRAAMLSGGDSGPAIVPGKAKESLLFKALLYSEKPRMPPKGRLVDGVIADFEKWINLGAPAPAGGSTAVKARGMSFEEGRKFWAYRLPIKPALPAVKDTAWVRTDIDAFILSRIEAKGWKPAADADRAALARRLYHDLVGLPPTPEDIDAFVKDPRSDAYEQLVDRLLASPHYGERWGRHWLDVARYAESLTLRGFIFKHAWRYRDYVVDSFNHDIPFDRFAQEQVAGDLMPAASPAEKRRQLIATTFLVLGNTNLEEQDKRQLRMDVVDEQLDAISRAFLAQTVTCARCHDHKFDPIPTKDYYALAGILRSTHTLDHANVSKWLEFPLPAEPEQEKLIRQQEKAVAELQARIKDLKAAIAKHRGPGDPKKPSVVAVADLAGIVVDDTQARKVGEWKVSQFSGAYVGTGYIHDLDAGKGEKTLTFQPEIPKSGRYEVRLAYSPGTNRAEQVPVTIFSADGEKTVHVNQKERPEIDGLFHSLGQYRFERSGQGYVIVSNEGTKGHVIADAVVFIPVEELPVGARKKPAGDKDLAVKEAAQLRQLEAQLKKLVESGPTRDLVMSVDEEKKIEDSPIHVRGSVHNLGPIAPRGFLQVASYGPPATLPAGQSGRRELAAWLVSRENPLPARVLANRAWHWLMGEGLVRTTDNFGTTGELPSHPELLDYLAVRCLEDGWSVKKLVRQIVLSHTYRQSGQAVPAVLAGDPENRLLARMNRRRLEAECIRDTMLSVSGRLQLDTGGPTFKPDLATDYGYKHSDTRRTVYEPVFRNALSDICEVFDGADPSVCTGRRNVSTVAPQALFMMNHPFVLEQARATAQRLLAEKNVDMAGRIDRVYRLALGRLPSTGERRLAERFVAGAGSAPKEKEDAFAQLVQALFASMDFRYVN
jgi:hypothetical protein